MTTITIKNDSNITFKKTIFEDINDLLLTIRDSQSDYNYAKFKDTKLTPELLEKTQKTREKIKDSPDCFFEI